MKCIYICPECRSFYGSERLKVTEKCPSCRTALVETEIDYETFASFSPEERKEFKKDYIHKHFPSDSKPYENTKTSCFTPLPESGWITFLQVMAWMGLAGCLVAGAVLLSVEELWLGLGLVVTVVIFCGVIFLLCTIASDIRHVRNQIDRYFFEKANEK